MVVLPPTQRPGFATSPVASGGARSSAPSFGASPAGQQIQTELNNAVQSVLLGNKTPKQALAWCHKAHLGSERCVAKRLTHKPAAKTATR